MRLNLILPVVEPEKYTKPEVCPRENCENTQFTIRQEVNKNIRDAEYERVTARRYQCKKCKHTFRVYPGGVLKGQMSQRMKGIAVMLYILGLSYGAVSIVMVALGIWISKSSVYRAVQAAGEKVPGMKQKQIISGYRTRALGADLTSVKCQGEWMTLGITVDDIEGIVLSIDHLTGEDAQTLTEWIEPIAETVGAYTLVTDDADALKPAADENGMDHQVCKSHVKRNTEAWIDRLTDKIKHGQDTSLAMIHMSADQALADLEQMGELIIARKPEDQSLLEELYLRYRDASPPRKGKKASVAYRMRNMFLDRWNLWPRLCFYRTWRDHDGNPVLDGTNNACERSIGWWIKERYRTMRGYKRTQSALNVSRLIAFCGNHLDAGLDLSSVIA